MMVACRKPARRLWEAGRFARARARLRCSSSCAAQYCALLRRPVAGSMPKALMLLSSSSSISPCEVRATTFSPSPNFHVDSTGPSSRRGCTFARSSCACLGGLIVKKDHYAAAICEEQSWHLPLAGCGCSGRLLGRGSSWSGCLAAQLPAARAASPHRRPPHRPLSVAPSRRPHPLRAAHQGVSYARGRQRPA